jgi:hypothetical protein
MRKRISTVTMSIAVLVMGALVAPAQASGSPAAGAQASEAQSYAGGAATPQELMERFRQAADEGDLAGIAACLAPEDRAGMSFGLILATGMMAAMGGLAAEMGEGFTEAFEEEMPEGEKAEADSEMTAMRKKTEELNARLEGVLTRYGVTDMMEETPSPAQSSGGEASGAELAAAMADVDQIGLIGELGALMRELGEGGEESSSGMPEGGIENLVIEGDRGTATLGGEPVELVRIDDRWFLHQPDSSSAAPAEPPH